ncbi:MAG TPA: heterodisulfide reductase, partial [Dehalococcoidia bacterium]|nr:heterodisulfide reductase [Dehalococcoidia bacterium]
GLAHSPKFIDESIAQAQAAASRALTILAQEEMKAGGAVCIVDKRKCTGCGICQKVCPFNAIEIETEEKVAVVTEALCKGCGICASSCRSGALDIAGVSDQQTLSLIQAL